MEKYLNEQSIFIRKKMELTSNEAVKQAVIAGLGCSIMPLIGIKNELQNGELQIVPIKEFPLTSTWNLVWLKEKKLSPVASSFLEYLIMDKIFPCLIKKGSTILSVLPFSRILKPSLVNSCFRFFLQLENLFQTR